MKSFGEKSNKSEKPDKEKTPENYVQQKPYKFQSRKGIVPTEETNS